jgi:hypothetical protein
VLVLGLGALGLYYAFFGRSVVARQVVVFGLLAGAGILALVTAVGVVMLVFSIWRGRVGRRAAELVGLAVHGLYPFALRLGVLLGLEPMRIQQSFIAVNNQLVQARQLRVAPDQLLVLVPHCVQRSTCPHKITVNVDNCHRCGRCVMTELLRLRDLYGVYLGVATGGTAARRFLDLYRPRLVVAVACERDLISGIQDAHGIPVWGITNERPHGPCLDTCVAPARLEVAIRSFARKVRRETDPDRG